MEEKDYGEAWAKKEAEAKATADSITAILPLLGYERKVGDLAVCKDDHYGFSVLEIISEDKVNLGDWFEVDGEKIFGVRVFVIGPDEENVSWDNQGRLEGLDWVTLPLSVCLSKIAKHHIINKLGFYQRTDWGMMKWTEDHSYSLLSHKALKLRNDWGLYPADEVDNLVKDLLSK